MAPIGRIHVRDGDGLDAIAVGRIRGASALSIFFQSMAATATAPDIAYGNSGSPADITTGAAICTVEGGTAPYTFLWSEAAAPDHVWNIISPTLASTVFEAEGIDPLAAIYATFKCTVTDANGNSVDSNIITVNVVNLGGG